MKRNRAPRSASIRFATASGSGTPRTSARNCGICLTAAWIKANRSACFRFRTGPSWMSGSTSTWKTFPSCRCISPRCGPMVVRGDTLIPVEQDIPLLPGEKPRDGDVPHAVARLQPVHRRDSLGSRHGAEDHRRDDAGAALGTREPRDRPRPGRVDGDQEAGRLFLMATAFDAAVHGHRKLSQAERREGSAAAFHRGQRGRRQSPR